MKIKLLQDISLLGTSVKLHKGKVYSASIAKNIPNFKERGLIFAHEREDDPVGVLLESGEYEMITL